SGPALVSFPQFVEYALGGDLARCEEIDGVIPNPARVSKRGAASLPVLGQTVPAATTKSPYGKDLDIDTKIEMDYGPFLDTVTRAFPGKVKPILFFETSRGCWWGQKAHCTFCGLNGTSMAYRAMSADLAVEQFDALFKHADAVAELHCVDNIMPREYLKDVLPRLDTPPGMEIFYEVKADLTEEDIRTLARARVRKIQPGIEALATSTLKLMKKGTTAHGNVRFLMHCALHGVEPMWNLLVGFPGEEEEVFRKYVADIPKLVHLPPPSGVFPVRFDRYSPYFVRAEEYGLQLQPLEFYELVYPFPAESIARMAYFFADENLFADYAMAVGTWITKMRQGVQAWRGRWSGGGEPPVLRFDSTDPTVVIDTRTGELVRHEIGEVGRAVLGCMSRPRTLAEVTRLLADFDHDVEAAVGDATARGLIFEEKGRLGSLVLPSAAEGRDGETACAVESTRFAPERSLAGVI
ncbi:MAG: RiPP maturation radical SAM C-methyltransferase, partial [Pyrinomonadaceae bacterium]